VAFGCAAERSQSVDRGAKQSQRAGVAGAKQRHPYNWCKSSILDGYAKDAA